MLEISALSVELGGRTALRSVDLKVAAGELVGLIGPNGAGKTTLLRSVLGLVPLQAGDIQVDGVAPVRGHIGYVPQRHEFAWDFPISVERAVMNGRRFGLRRWSGPDDRAAVAEALDQVELTDLRGRPIGELSGGQRQRVLVARALVTRPKVLLLDEPFTGLDVRTQDLLTGLFTSLKKGRALLMTTHDLPAASAMCDRLYLLNKEVIADGPPDELTDPAVWLGAFGVVVR